MDRAEIDAHVERLKGVVKNPELVEHVEGHRGLLYGLYKSPSGRKFLEHPALGEYLANLERVFGKSSAATQKALLKTVDEFLTERNTAVLAELPPDHGLHRLISKAILRRHTNALSLAAAALLDFKRDLDDEGYWRAHPETLMYLDYFHATYPDVGRHKLGDAARTLLRLATHSRASDNGPLSLRFRVFDAMRRWAVSGVAPLRGYRSFSELRGYLRNLAIRRGVKGTAADVFIRRFFDRTLEADLAEHVFRDVSRASMVEMPSSAVRNVFRMVREFPELLHAVHVVRDLRGDETEDLSPLHRQALSGLDEFFIHYATGQHEHYLERLFRRWAAEASRHIFGKQLSHMDAEQRRAAEAYLRDLWNAMNRSVSTRDGVYLFGKTHITDMLRSLYAEVSCFTPHTGSGNVPDAMSLIFLPHARESTGEKYQSVPIVPSFAVLKKGSDPRGRILTYFDYTSGRLVLGSYGGSVGPREAENAALKYARQFNADLEKINKKHADALSEVFLKPSVSPIREIIVGDESRDFDTHVVHSKELIPFYGDYLEKSGDAPHILSLVFGRRIDVS